MEAHHIDRFGSADGIVLRSSEDPRPGPKEILMRVRASSLNYRDLMVLKGGGRGPTKLGVVPLSDGAGEVAAIGDGVTRVKIGDRIAGCFHPRWFGGPIKPDYLTDRLGANLDGMLAECGVLSEEALVHMPSHLSFEEAATWPCAAVWVALAGYRRINRGRHGSDPRLRARPFRGEVAAASLKLRMGLYQGPPRGPFRGEAAAASLKPAVEVVPDDAGRCMAIARFIASKSARLPTLIEPSVNCSAKTETPPADCHCRVASSSMT